MISMFFLCIAKNLQSLYGFMYGKLIDANLSKNPQPAQVVLEMLFDLRSAWSQLSKQNKTPAPQPTATGSPGSVKSIRLKG